MTNCPNCGAPFTGRKCEYCGTCDPDRKNDVRIYVDPPKIPPPEHWETIGNRLYFKPEPNVFISWGAKA